MAANPPHGAVTPEDAHETLKVISWTSPIIDISASSPSLADEPILHFPDYAIAIRAARLIYQAVSSNTEGFIKIGITSDDDAIVASTATYDASPASTVGMVQELTLATTLKSPTLQKAYGYPVVPKATTIQMDITQGASNAGDFRLQIDYFKITPSK